MFEDDLEDNYLLEAIEAVENSQPHKIVTGDLNIENDPLISCDKFLTTSKVKTNNFRSRLLQTLCNKEKILAKTSLNQDKPYSSTSSVVEQSPNHFLNLNFKNSVDSSRTNVIPKELSLQTLKNINYDTGNALMDVHLISNKSIFSSSRHISLNNIEESNPRSPASKFSLISQEKNNHIPSTTAKHLTTIPIVRKRKFPGPAGLLPYWTQDIKSDPVTNSLEEEKTNGESFYTENTVCSQNSAADFCYAWKQMTTELYDLLRFNPLQSVNIRWLLRRVTFRGDVVAQKIPFLVVMIQSIDLSHQDATAVFKDETGEMNGIISHKVVEEYASLISQGTVFVLKDVTILSPDGFRVCISLKGQQRKHYINVTTNSIVRLYSPNDTGKVTKTEVSELKKDDLRFSLANINKSEPKSVVEENELDSVNEDPLEPSAKTNLHSPGGRVHQNHNKNFIQPEFKIPSVKNYPPQKFITAPLENTAFKNNAMVPTTPKLSLQKTYSSPLQSRILNSSFNVNTNYVAKSSVNLDRSIDGTSGLKWKGTPDKSSFNAFATIEVPNRNISAVTIPSTSTNNIKLSKNETKFRFTNKINVSRDYSDSPFSIDFNAVISEQTAPVFSENTKQPSTDRPRENCFHSNMATPPDQLSNKKQKVDVYDDDDDDFDLLISSIDTDSIMKNIF